MPNACMFSNEQSDTFEIFSIYLFTMVTLPFQRTAVKTITGAITPTSLSLFEKI